MEQLDREMRSILIIDDDPDRMSNVERELARGGYKRIRREREIIKAVDFFEKGEQYDIVFLGFPPAKASRIYVLLDFIKHKSPHTACFCICAPHDAGVEGECLKRGATGWMTAPLREGQIALALSKLSSPERVLASTRESVLEPTREPPRGSIRVLILEDDPVSGSLIAKYLEPYGECDIFRDGRSAIDAFRKAIWGKSYHLVILDIMVPDIHGRDVLRMIREAERKKGISNEARARIIMTTALSDAGNIIESFKAACDSYLIKPIEKGKLIGEIQSLGLLQYLDT
ncbi:MAG TPA: response regulator [Syntrophales bacterium]|nr:response regulator [Syntrophales bacterium]